MTKAINDKLTILECLLINELDPGYLEVSYQMNFIYILVSKYDYKHYSLSERIYDVFEVLKIFADDILKEFPVIVETLDSTELSGLFWMYSK